MPYCFQSCYKELVDIYTQTHQAHAVSLLLRSPGFAIGPCGFRRTYSGNPGKVP